jgi:hypothetical protein
MRVSNHEGLHASQDEHFLECRKDYFARVFRLRSTRLQYVLLDLVWSLSYMVLNWPLSEK